MIERLQRKAGGVTAGAGKNRVGGFSFKGEGGEEIPPENPFPGRPHGKTAYRGEAGVHPRKRELLNLSKRISFFLLYQPGNRQGIVSGSNGREFFDLKHRRFQIF